MTTALIFVYDSDKETASALLDTGHKTLSPSTYQCSLCELTQDALADKELWREFRKSIGLPMEFFHRDEFERKYDLKFDYPVILLQDNKIEVLLNKKRIDAISGLDELIETVREEITKKS